MLKYREVITVKTVALDKNLYFFIKSLKSRKKKLALTSFYYFSQETRLDNSKSLFALTSQDSTFSHTCENSKMFTITSKYFIFFNNKPPASWVAYITRDFLTSYSRSYYSQKQPPKGVIKKRCSENTQQIYRRTPMPKCDFNKVAFQLYWNHTSAWVFSCKFIAYFQNTFS